MALILKLDLDIVKMYHHTKNEVSMSTGSKVIAQTDRHTDTTKTLPLPLTREVKKKNRKKTPTNKQLECLSSQRTTFGKIFVWKFFEPFYCMKLTFDIHLSEDNFGSRMLWWEPWYLVCHNVPVIVPSPKRQMDLVAITNHWYFDYGITNICHWLFYFRFIVTTQGSARSKRDVAGIPLLTPNSFILT